MRAIALTVVAVLLFAGCERSEDRDISPWFRLRVYGPPDADGAARAEALVKQGMFWTRIAEHSAVDARAIDARTVVFTSGVWAHVIHEGESQSRRACEGKSTAISFPPGIAGWDCTEVLEGSLSMPTRIHWRRLDADLRVVAEQSFAAPQGRAFVGAGVRFYDRSRTPFFVARSADARAPGCTLQGAGRAEPVYALPRMGIADCSSAPIWTRLAGVPLEAAR